MSNHELILKAAAEYRRLGWWPLPLHGKAPYGDKWPETRLGEEQLTEAFRPGDNLGLILGAASGGLVDVDLDHPLAVRLAPSLLPPTPMRHGRKSSGVSHWWYQSEAKAVQRWQLPAAEETKRVTLVELRSNGGQTMVPPSIHPSGELVQWIKGYQLTPAKVAQRELAAACQVLAGLTVLGLSFVPGRRNDLAMRLGGWWAKAGVPREKAEEWIAALSSATDDDDPENRLGAVRSSYDKHAREEAVSGWQELAESLGEDRMKLAERWLGLVKRGGRTGARRITPDGGQGGTGSAKGNTGVNPYRYELSLLLHLSDEGNATRFLHLNRARVLHCALLGGWYCWDGMRWVLDSTNRALSFARECARGIAQDALGLDHDVSVEVVERAGGKHRETVPLDDARAVCCHWASQTLGAERMGKMLELAAADPAVAVMPEQLDADPWLLNCQTGTLQLGERAMLSGGSPLAPHAPLQRITKLAPAAYDPAALAPRWEQFLSEIFGDDAELISFMRRLAGYCLFGGNPEQVIAFFYGTGANGKGTFVRAMLALLGDYVATVPVSAIMARESGNNNQVYALARMKGARLVTLEESDEGDKLAEGLVKTMTGGDRISARLPHGAFFEFTPEFFPIVSTNHMPNLRNVDEAIARRLLLVPFKVTIPAEHRDSGLDAELQGQLSGILNWALAGLVDYHERIAEGKRGLAPPESVRAATREYLSDQDPFTPFMQERCLLSADVRCQKGALYRDYRTWAESNGQWAVAANKFGGLVKRKLMEHYNAQPDAIETHGGNQRWWVGIGLTDAPESGGGLYG